MSGVHPSHKTRFSDASTFDEVCTVCGATDEIGGFGNLQYPCKPREKNKNMNTKTEETETKLYQLTMTEKEVHMLATYFAVASIELGNLDKKGKALALVAAFMSQDDGSLAKRIGILTASTMENKDV